MDFQNAGFCSNVNKNGVLISLSEMINLNIFLKMLEGKNQATQQLQKFSILSEENAR